jgi:hypothetical protein
MELVEKIEQSVIRFDQESGRLSIRTEYPPKLFWAAVCLVCAAVCSVLAVLTLASVELPPQFFSLMILSFSMLLWIIGFLVGAWSLSRCASEEVIFDRTRQEFRLSKEITNPVQHELTLIHFSDIIDVILRIRKDTSDSVEDSNAWPMIIRVRLKSGLTISVFGCREREAEWSEILNSKKAQAMRLIINRVRHILEMPTDPVPRRTPGSFIFDEIEFIDL